MSPIDVPRKVYRVPLSLSKSTDIAIAEPDLRADNLNLTTWTSSFVLARQLHHLTIHFAKNEDIPILELGAGTGLVGLTAAILWRQNVILTDLPGIVPGLRANIELNLDSLKMTSLKVDCGTLDWKRVETLQLESGEVYSANSDKTRQSSGRKATVIFAADTIYDEEHPELISNAILTWLARTESARAILCYALRFAYLDQVREIWTLLEEGGLVAERDGQERADSKDWDDECLCEWVVWKWKDIQN